jgi:pimeloyl-ACP methyl ester carboxylesterase
MDMMFDSLWKHERSENLYYRSLKNTMADKALVFLHGLGGSNHYWDDVYKKLGKRYTLYFVDLLGFGRSAKPDAAYTLDDHITALRNFIRYEVLETSVDLIGHSLGALIALGYSARFPRDVDRVFLLSPGYYRSRQDARDHMHRSHDLAAFLDDTPYAQALCDVICGFRPLIRAAAPYIMPDLPPQVARDVFLHTHTSYFSTLRNLMYGVDASALVTDANRGKVTILHGTKDVTVPYDNARRLAKKHNLKLVPIVDAGHDFPLHHPEQVVGFLN